MVVLRPSTRAPRRLSQSTNPFAPSSCSLGRHSADEDRRRGCQLRGDGKRGIAAKELRDFPVAIPRDHRQQHPSPEPGTGLIATPQQDTFQIAELIEEEHRMVTQALEVPVGRALLPTVGLADRAVQIENQLFQRLALVDRVDPAAGELHQFREVALAAERLGLESADLAGGSGAFI